MKNKLDMAFRAFMALTEDEKIILFTRMMLSDRTGLRIFAKTHGVGTARAENALRRKLRGEETWAKPPPFTADDVITKGIKVLKNK